ncbi:hypothetical protein LINPERPRIM_LOCUS17142 [Linum perenne]
MNFCLLPSVSRLRLLLGEAPIGSFMLSFRWLETVGFTRAKVGGWKLRSPGSRVLSTGRLLMWTDLFFGALLERRLEELYGLRMGGLLVLLSQVWVPVLLLGES